MEYPQQQTTMILKLACICSMWLSHSLAATATGWKPRSIYQIMTDRFALTNGSTTAPCDTAAQTYCGGTWRGIINNLDYIQNMGFDAVCTVPVDLY